VQSVQLTADAPVTADVPPFGAAVLVDPRRRGPSVWFPPMDGAGPRRNRGHADVLVPDDVPEALAAGWSTTPTHRGQGVASS
jgi:4a-hydroxytetrahydrobiopterin dehydratase